MVGGGNSAVEEALYLSNIANEVVVVHRRDSFRAEKILCERLLARPNVAVRWNRAIDEILGHDESARRHRRAPARRANRRAVDDRRRRRLRRDRPRARRPNSSRGQLALKPNGYVQTKPGSTATSIEGVFAAGDVADDIFRQAVTAAGLGCMAALEAERWLALAGAGARRGRVKRAQNLL